MGYESLPRRCPGCESVAPVEHDSAIRFWMVHAGAWALALLLIVGAPALA